MEWGTPVQWGWFLLFSRSGGHKTKEAYPTTLGSPTPCKQALSHTSYISTRIPFFNSSNTNILNTEYMQQHAVLIYHNSQSNPFLFSTLSQFVLARPQTLALINFFLLSLSVYRLLGKRNSAAYIQTTPRDVGTHDKFCRFVNKLH